MIRFLVAIMLFAFSMTAVLPIQASETIKGAQKDMESFKKEMAVKLDEVEKKLESLRDQAKDKGTAAKEKTIEGLEKSKDQLETELNALKEDTQSGWDRTKQNFAKALDNLNAKIQKAAKKYNILDSNRIDQQNHGTILISDDNLRMDSNFIPSSEFAFISKAVGGYGEMVSQIKINGDPSIVILEKIEKCFSIFHDFTNMEDIFKSGVNYFVNYGKKLYYNDNFSN